MCKQQFQDPRPDLAKPEVDSAGKFLFVLVGCKSSAGQIYPGGCFSFILVFLSLWKANPGASTGTWRMEDLNVCAKLVSLSRTGISSFIGPERGTQWKNISTAEHQNANFQSGEVQKSPGEHLHLQSLPSAKSCLLKKVQTELFFNFFFFFSSRER